MSKVKVDYSDFNSNIIEKITIPLFKDILFEIKVNDKNENVTLVMKDKVSSNEEIEGELEYEELNSVLKALTMVKKQNQKDE